jgi:hypothetical protein
MASNKELERMINNLEKAITKVNLQLLSMNNPFEGVGSDYDPNTGLSIRFLKLQRRQSKLIEVSTKLQLQHLDNYKKERSNK